MSKTQQSSLQYYKLITNSIVQLLCIFGCEDLNVKGIKTAHKVIHQECTLAHEQLVKLCHTALEIQIQEIKLCKSHTGCIIDDGPYGASRAVLHTLTHSNESEGLCFIPHTK